jgi:hypothetical protein
MAYPNEVIERLRFLAESLRSSRERGERAKRADPGSDHSFVMGWLDGATKSAADEIEKVIAMLEVE